MGQNTRTDKNRKENFKPNISVSIRDFCLVEEEGFFTNGYGLYFREQESNGIFNDLINPITKEENIDVVQKILNSYIMDYYVTKTSVAIEGGYPCYQKNFIEKFTIPELTESEIEIIRSLNDPQEIDDFLIEKYQIKVLAGNLAV
ncbi:MAG: hypothetical protein V9F01_03750 [Chitinophagaceae bacterium]